MQLAKHFGAHVTGVCSTANLELVRSVGADEVVDYTREDFSNVGRVYNVVFDAVGYSGFSRSLRSLKRGGVYIRVGGSGAVGSILGGMLRGLWVSMTGAATVVGGVANGTPADQAFLKTLIEAGQLRTVIDRRYSLEQIAEAHWYVEAGHKIRTRGHRVRHLMLSWSPTVVWADVSPVLVCLSTARKAFSEPVSSRGVVGDRANVRA